MRKGLALSALIAVAGVAFATPAFAYTSPGSPSGYVNDFAQVLSAGKTQELDARLAAFEQATSNEITVVTVPSMDGDYIENYAAKLFEEWGIGKKNTDNGVLLLLALEERKLRIEVGYGLEGALPDSVAQSIITNEITPLLKAGDYDGAVTAGVAGIEAATKGEYQGESNSGSMSGEDLFFLFVLLPLFALQWFGAILGRSKSWWAGGIVGALGGLTVWAVFGLVLWFGFVLVGGLAVLGLLFDYFVSHAYSRSKTLGVHPPWWAGGGGSHGGGFGGFGGGSSGGGGASGSW